MENASSLIGILMEKRDEIPRKPSEAQLKLLNQKIEQLKMSEHDACKIVGANSFDELQGGPKGNASELIGLLIKKSGGSTRRRRGRKK